MCHLIFGIAVVLKVLISNRDQIQNLSEEHKLQKLKLKGTSGTSYTEGHKGHFGLSTIYVQGIIQSKLPLFKVRNLNNFKISKANSGQHQLSFLTKIKINQ